MKLKIWWEAILSLWTIWHIDPYLLQQIEEKNRNIIINSTFTGDINEKELLNSSDIDNNIREYKNKSHRIHILYIKKTSPEKKFYIPPYQSTKKIRISQQQRKKYINDYQWKHYEILSDKRMDPDNDYIHDSSENLRELSYTFINKDFFNHYLSNAK
jgi:transcriptional regulator with AAA-type ATPase domain